jgi:hypothetical protein
MKTVIATDAGARPVGPYSQAVRANGLIFGDQIPFDPKTDGIVDGGIAAQTDRALRNVATRYTDSHLGKTHLCRTMGCGWRIQTTIGEIAARILRFTSSFERSDARDTEPCERLWSPFSAIGDPFCIARNRQPSGRKRCFHATRHSSRSSLRIGHSNRSCFASGTNTQFSGASPQNDLRRSDSAATSCPRNFS